MSTLVICESPGKIKNIQKYLGSGYIVTASVGHIFDLPEKELGIDIKNNFKPTFAPKKDKKEVLNNILSLAKKSDSVILLTDPDREGEGIAKNIYDYIHDKIKNSKIFRATTSEITKKGITDAINNLGEINEDKVNSYLARRMLDRLCGFKTSWLTKSATGGTSAGRVQSVILRLIAERELEILSFIPEEYWIISAIFKTNKNENYEAFLSDKIKISNKEQADSIYNKIINGKPFIQSIETKEVKSNPSPPFTTFSMTAAANSILGWSASKTLNVAQGLYQDSMITYHRTDSFFISDDAMQNIRNYIDSTYHDCLPHNKNEYKNSKSAQEAHECCRPTDITNSNPHLDGDSKKLYELIWKRTVASQMIAGKDERTKIITNVNNYEFITNGHVVLFDGHRRVWDYSTGEDKILPKVKEKDSVSLEKLSKDQKFTSPPSRYTDGSLVKDCEKLQIARPATFGNFIETLKKRKYITQKGKSLQATELGLNVTKFLKDSDMCFVHVDFTSEMEDLLDQIQEKKFTKEDVLKKFWDRLKSDIEKGKTYKKNNEKSEHKCPDCNGFLLKKHSKFGSFYACENYNAKKKDGCKYTAKIGENNVPIKKEVKQKEYLDFECIKCHSKMVKRTGKYGDFGGCEKYPACKAVSDLLGTFKEKTYNKFNKFKKKKNDKEETE